MRICVFGAGAIGGHLAARLTLSGHEVSVIVRDPVRRAIDSQGLRLETAGRVLTARVRAAVSVDDAIGPQDAVFVTLKATALAAAAPQLPALLQADTPVIFVLNGIPWWYFTGIDADTLPFPPVPLADVGLMTATLGVGNVVGGVVLSSNEVVAPGVIRNASGARNEWTLGEIDGRVTPRLTELTAALTTAGLGGRASPDIRSAVWHKLVSTNIGRAPLCALLDRDTSVFANPELRALATAIMQEAEQVAAAWGVTLEIDPDRALRSGDPAAGHVPSLLQDFRRGRRAEIDAMLGAVQQFARRAGVAIPHIDAVAALLRQRGADLGVYP